MGWEDRPYYRDRGGSTGNPLTWLLTGSVPLFTAFGIRVRAHASLVVVVALVLLFGLGSFGDSIAARVQSMTMLFVVILLHEFGHCFGARWTGGSADEIVMTPLGGLAMTMARRRPWPTFVTVAAGPAVNVILCLVCGLGLWLILRVFPITPNTFVGTYRDIYTDGGSPWLDLSNWLYWIYATSFFLLIFNLLPVFPLDGGQLLQSILWKPMGYYRSMILALTVGLVGSVLMFMVGIATFGTFGGGLLLILIAVSCFMTCFQTRAMMKAEGPWAFQDEDSIDFGYGSSSSSYASSLAPETPRRRARKPGLMASWATRRARRQAREEAGEQEKIDAILDKVSHHGMHSLSWWEKRLLRKATERQRKRDSQMTRGRGN